MTKADIIHAVVQKCDISQKKAEETVSAFLESIIRAINKGEEVELRGFGCFRIRERGFRMGRNPRTGESVPVEAKKVAYFKMGKSLKDQINS